jgi:PAS domain S-box-containing protein
MLSSMEEGVLAIDNEGTILSLNEACATLLGEEPTKLRGRSIYEVIRKADLWNRRWPARRRWRARFSFAAPRTAG